MLVIRVTELEFDDDLLLGEIADAERLGLRIFGFATMTEARALLRPAVGPSRPGSPPHDHTGLLRRFLGYGPEAKSVVIGPRLLSRRSQDAPRGLETGLPSRNTRGQQIRVQRRPFMLPAFQQACRQALPAAFANSLRD